jgi:hypothetical protein
MILGASSQAGKSLPKRLADSVPLSAPQKPAVAPNHPQESSDHWLQESPDHDHFRGTK